MRVSDLLWSEHRLGGRRWCGMVFARNWTIKTEYLHVDLGSRSVAGTTVPSAVPPGVFTAFSEQREHIGRAGVNYSLEWGSPRGTVRIPFAAQHCTLPKPAIR
jgi:hypothetical protein